MSTLNQPNESAPVLTARVFWILFTLIALVGTSIRVTDSAAWRRTGPDELMYRRYVNMMDGYEGTVGVFPSDARTARTGSGGLVAYTAKIQNTGAMAMPEMADFYIETQKNPDVLCELPPTRFLYIYTSWLWKRVQFGDTPPLAPALVGKPGTGDSYSKDADHTDPALTSLHRVAAFFSILLMITGGLCAWRIVGRGAGLAVLALMACDPVQIHLSQHAMIDGFFAFWAAAALWTTWECLKNPASRGWLAAHTVVLALMVLTKENAFFVYCALGVVVVANRWLRFGTVTPSFLVCSFAGGALGFLTLVTLAGGFGNFLTIYQSLVGKAQELAYAQNTGDGPWYRYLLDLMTVSPIVLVLALGALFALAPQRREIAFLALFVAGSYLIMCNVKYGMNLRYASIWELPLRTAAFAMLWQICSRLGRWQWIAATVLVAALCAYEFRQYSIFATDPARPLYELVPSQMLRLINVIKG